MKHELKILPEYFEAVTDLEKTFEVRKRDRFYAIDDCVVLREWDEKIGMFTGRKVFVRITYILDNAEYCKEGYVIFAFEIIEAWLYYNVPYMLEIGKEFE